MKRQITNCYSNSQTGPWHLECTECLMLISACHYHAGQSTFTSLMNGHDHVDMKAN